MNIIAQNPYRVLGMFANDSSSVMKANIARIRAYSLVGEQIKFPSDHEEVFGPVDRSEKAVQEAVAQLSDPVSARTWQFFWIHSSEDGNEKIDTASTSTASDINRAVLAIVEKSGNEELAATAYARVFEKRCNDITLFDSATFWNDEQEKVPVAKEFVDLLDALIPARELLYGAKRYNSWFWWFRSRLEEGNVLRNAVEVKYKAFAMEGLENINSDRIGVAPHYRKYRKLLWLARPYLDILGTFTADDGQIPEEILVVRDTLAQHLVDFCYQVYERNTYWDAVDLEDMCEFLSKDVSPLAYLGSTKDLLADKCDEFKEKSQLLAPEECKAQSDSIRKLIKDFRKKKGSVQLALALLRDAEEPLTQIRETVGARNLFCRHISTRVADSAIRGAEAEISAAENIHDIVENCRELAAQIESLDLEEEFAAGKLRAYMQRIADPAPVEPADQGTVEIFAEQSDCVDFRSSDEDDTDTDAQAGGLRSLPEPEPCEVSDEDVILDEKLEDIAAEEAATQKTVGLQPADVGDAYGAAGVDDEELVFAEAKKRNNYTDYLKKYPQGRYAKIAERQIEYEFYQRVLRSRAFGEYYNCYPEGEYTQLVRDAEEKDRLNRCVTREDLEQYLADYPDGKYRTEAEAELNRDQRSGQSTRLAIIIAALLLIAALALIFC